MPWVSRVVPPLHTPGPGALHMVEQGADSTFDLMALAGEALSSGSALDRLPVAVCVWRPDTTIVWANRRYRDRIAGGEEPVGRRWLTDFLEAEVRHEVALVVTDVVSRPRWYTNQHSVMDPSGRRRRFLWVNRPLVADDVPESPPGDGATDAGWGDSSVPEPHGLFFQSVGFEVTEEMSWLLEGEQPESGFDVFSPPFGPLRNLAGGVAHGVNSHLATILTHAEMALSERGSVESTEAHLLEILAAVGRCGDLTRTLLSFAGRRPFFRRPGTLDEMVEAMVPGLQRVVGRSIRLRWLPGAGDGRVRVDPERLEEALDGLLTNARDAILAYRVVRGEPHHGEIVLSTTEIRRRTFETEEASTADAVTAVPGRRYFAVTVRDDGIGMESAVAQRALDPFFTTKRGVGAQGLGLSAAQGFALQNGGLLEIESTPGLGTAVRLLLPPMAAEPAPIRFGSPSRESPSDLPPQILLVEDDAALLRVMARFLTRMGYRVQTAADAEEGLDWARVHGDSLDLLITDVLMPGRSGVELQEILEREGVQPPCLFISGFTADFLESRQLSADGVRFLAKPFSLDALSTAVRELLESRKASGVPG
ncbi:MAG: response regulator [Gemmatimonadales bacterium]|nr:MAG: response regulator [Gemmatimonadales bacterium]